MLHNSIYGKGWLPAAFNLHVECFFLSIHVLRIPFWSGDAFRNLRMSGWFFNFQKLLPSGLFVGKLQMSLFCIWKNIRWFSIDWPNMEHVTIERGSIDIFSVILKNKTFIMDLCKLSWTGIQFAKSTKCYPELAWSHGIPTQYKASCVSRNGLQSIKIMFVGFWRDF